jgi:hypothetical protein
MKRFYQCIIRKLVLVGLVFVMLCCIGGPGHQNTHRAWHAGEGPEDRITARDADRYNSDFETDKTVKKVNEECTERILECFNRIEKRDLDDISDRLFSLLENADKIKALLIAARIEPEKRAFIIEIAEKGLTLENVKEICEILNECLNEDEMSLVANLAEKYTGKILRR